MVSHGLDTEYAEKVFLKSPKFADNKNSQQIEPVEFSSYALVGLKNFFLSNPEKFRSRLSKGPPPQFRWLAWRFIAMQIIQK